jgi:hypothetical protein
MCQPGGDLASGILAATGAGPRSRARALSQDLAQLSQRFSVLGAVSPLLGRDYVRQVGRSDDKAVALDDVRSVDEVLVTLVGLAAP